MVATKKPRRRRPLTQTLVPHQPHPSIGQGFAYGQDTRDMAMIVRAMGLEEHPTFNALRGMYHFPSKRTTRRWRQRLQDRGTTRRFHRQGNRRAAVLVGTDALNLVLFRSIFPKSTAAQLNAMLFRAQLGRGEQFPRFFSPSQITRASVSPASVDQPLRTRPSSRPTSSSDGFSRTCPTPTASPTSILPT